MAMDVVDYEIFGDDMQYVEIELDPGEAAIGEAGAMMMMQDGIEMDTASATARTTNRFDGQIARRRQALAHRRVVVHDHLPQRVPAEATRRLRRAVSGQDHRCELGGDGRHAHLPEGQLRVRSARRVARDCVSAQARRRTVRRRRLHHAAPRRRWSRLRCKCGRTLMARDLQPGECCASTRGVWSRSNPRSISTSNTSAS